MAVKLTPVCLDGEGPSFLNKAHQGNFMEG